MKTIAKVLKFLSGKKGVIASIILTVNGYLAAKEVYGELEVVLVGALVTIIFGGASYATRRLVYAKK